LRKGDVVATLQAEAGALGLVRGDGATNRCAGDSAKGRGMAIARRRAEGKTERRSKGGSAERAIIGSIRHAGDLAAGILAAFILILLKDFERLVGSGEDADRGTHGLHGAAGK
jgi:hypothetical protein